MRYTLLEILIWAAVSSVLLTLLVLLFQWLAS